MGAHFLCRGDSHHFLFLLVVHHKLIGFVNIELQVVVAAPSSSPLYPSVKKQSLREIVHCGSNMSEH